MKNQTYIFTEEEYAKDEPSVSAETILAEIKPLMSDFFYGDISFDGQGITYCLPNGQKFILSAKEIA